MQSSLFEHTNPTPEQSYRFWGAVRDLRPGEFWQLHGTAHGQSLPQLFAYDVGVSVENGDGHNGRLPNTERRPPTSTFASGASRSTPSPTARSHTSATTTRPTRGR